MENISFGAPDQGLEIDGDRIRAADGAILDLSDTQVDFAGALFMAQIWSLQRQWKELVCPFIGKLSEQLFLKTERTYSPLSNLRVGRHILSR